VKELVFLRKSLLSVNLLYCQNGIRNTRNFSTLALTRLLFNRYDAALMFGALPEEIEPFRAAEVGRSFRGDVPIAKMPRLAAELYSKSGLLQVEIEFLVDNRLVRSAWGAISGNIHARCQRCLGDIELPIDIGFRLGIVFSENDFDRLPEDYEPLLVTGDMMKTLDIIEDEVILALPGVLVHEVCSTGHKNHVLDEILDEPRKNPFAVLEELKPK